MTKASSLGGSYEAGYEEERESSSSSSFREEAVQISPQNVSLKLRISEIYNSSNLSIDNFLLKMRRIDWVSRTRKPKTTRSICII